MNSSRSVQAEEVREVGVVVLPRLADRAAGAPDQLHRGQEARRIALERPVVLVVEVPEQPQPIPQAVQADLPEQPPQRLGHVHVELLERRRPLRRAGEHVDVLGLLDDRRHELHHAGPVTEGAHRADQGVGAQRLELAVAGAHVDVQ
jgi:hypothetical protein